MPNFDVTVCRLGTVTVQAATADEAIKLVQENSASADINWDDTWSVTDAVDMSEDEEGMRIPAEGKYDFAYNIAVAFFDEAAYSDCFTCDADRVAWLKLARAICDCYTRNDEARFSLYDYLDAVINRSDCSIPSLLEEYKTDADAFFRKMVDMADEQRKVYEAN